MRAPQDAGRDEGRGSRSLAYAATYYISHARAHFARYPFDTSPSGQNMRACLNLLEMRDASGVFMGEDAAIELEAQRVPFSYGLTIKDMARVEAASRWRDGYPWGCTG